MIDSALQVLKNPPELVAKSHELRKRICTSDSPTKEDLTEFINLLNTVIGQTIQVQTQIAESIQKARNSMSYVR